MRIMTGEKSLFLVSCLLHVVKAIWEGDRPHRYIVSSRQDKRCICRWLDTNWIRLSFPLLRSVFAGAVEYNWRETSHSSWGQWEGTASSRPTYKGRLESHCECCTGLSEFWWWFWKRTRRWIPRITSFCLYRDTSHSASSTYVQPRQKIEVRKLAQWASASERWLEWATAETWRRKCEIGVRRVNSHGHRCVTRGGFCPPYRCSGNYAGSMVKNYRISF